MRIACLLADPSFAESPGVAELLAAPELELVEAPGGVGTAATLEDAFRWAGLLGERLARPDVEGAVAVLAPDVLSELAYLLELAVGGSEPLVATSALRPPGHRAPDAAGNLAASLQLARHPVLVGSSAMVVIAGRVHAARDVLRICSTSVDAFASPLLGPLGIVAPHGPVTLTRRPPRREHLPVGRIEPAVAHVAALLGIGSGAVDAAVAGGARGLVVETFGGGGVPPAMGEGMARAVGVGVTVVAASRTRGGPRDDPAPGGSTWLRERGVLVAHGLAPEKARVRLALALGLDAPERVREAFAPPTPVPARTAGRPASGPRSRP